MTGRGIDQVLPFPSNPILHETYVKNASDYVRLAESMNGPIHKPVKFDSIWGIALEQLEQVKPDLRIINLETVITSSQDWENKGIHYRMNPWNIPCLQVAKIDCCALANNHVLDWGESGLIDTLNVLQEAQIQSCGAGINREMAENPAVLPVPGKGRVLVYSLGLESSGIPETWAATDSKPGVYFLHDMSSHTIQSLNKKISKVKLPNDIVIASVHWGGNWGYEIQKEERAFAESLIDQTPVDIVHGHSSHHAKGMEIYGGKLILYGCGDFINDYEGIRGYEEFRADLALMYFLSVATRTGKVNSLRIVPLQMKNFRLNPICRKDAQWLEHTLNREGKEFGTQFLLKQDNSLVLNF